MDHRPGAPFPLSADLPHMLGFAGEFGAELNSFLPFVFWLHMAGLMRGRSISTYRGMRPFYFFLDADQIIERADARAYSFPIQRPAWLPNRDDHAARRSPFEMFPDYRTQFRDERLAGDKPLLIVHNKYSVEWGRAPVNFFDTATLTQIFAACEDRFRIIYLRPGIVAPLSGYSRDHQDDLALDDLAVVRRHGDVTLFEDLCGAYFPTLTYNEAKLRLYASAHHHVTVQGGNAHLTALFSGGLVSILHRHGQELRHSYRHGHFARASTPAPIWLICRTQSVLLQSLAVMQMSDVADDRVLVSPSMASLVEALARPGALPPRLQAGDPTCPRVSGQHHSRGASVPRT